MPRPDTLSVVLRSLSFVALLQAAGVSVFIALFHRRLEASSALLGRIALASAITAMVGSLAHYAMEPARMADAMSGIVDAALQRMVLHSRSTTVLAVRLLGLGFIVMASRRRHRRTAALGLIGALLVAGSFTLTGHTLANPLRPVLSPLLLLHVLVVAGWFGALASLYVVAGCETAARAARIIEDFSRLAAWVVPGILVAGVTVAFVIIPDGSTFSRPYGRLLIAKVSGFALLMGLAALNKWCLGPAVASGDARARRAFRLAVGIEYGLIVAVLGVTAVMTTFFSPED